MFLDNCRNISITLKFQPTWAKRRINCLHMIAVENFTLGQKCLSLVPRTVLINVELARLAAEFCSAYAYLVFTNGGSEMLDENCVGVYVPRERRFIPNDGSRLPELHRISSLREHSLM